MRSSLIVTLALSCAVTGAAFALQKPDTTAANPARVSVGNPAAVDRIVVIGASMSAGFRLDGNSDVFARPTIVLSDIVEASLNVKHAPVVDGSNGLFFADPRTSMATAMKVVAEKNPTLVVGLDYLFWFGYGTKKEEQRLPDLERALEGLAKLQCPILVGDLPDMTIASTTPDPIMGAPMLKKSMLPSAETLKKLNERIAEFAQAHPNVVVVPLASLTANLLADTAVTVRGNTYPKGSIDKLMQGDRLHTTLEGTCAAWVLALDTWMAKAKDVTPATFELDVPKLAAKVAEMKKGAAAGEKQVEKPAPK